ncbi:MAG TPA: YerC/YecD family TrpR-related protein [Bacilli bacterium]|nr:YerC/YecD family TrpR-related protein [Bacilli bacterium]
MNQQFPSDHRDLFQTILALETIEECESFFKDLCTIKEVEAMAQRLYAARLIAAGKTFTQIEELTGISSTTLSRVSQAYKYGSGYKKALTKK